MTLASDRKPWVPAVILVGVGYFVVGVVSASLANPAVSDQLRVMYRLGAWVASAVLFASHIGFEHFRRATSTLTTALHAAMAVALGAFLLAFAATVHAATVPSHAPYSRHLLALVLWPIITALPAFLVGLAAAWTLARLATKHPG